ncbi:hypothetical protein KSX_35150 [Ktedonospora formicarum]|uniref:Uncharacterized protein n=1 Tax=Ktedonospora formicarum TaxID=2778364 RepID=A0A8J3I349_9CHLR|nr:hypothetical protein KSX_35150 [Ktedonospora formicarum]
MEEVLTGFEGTATSSEACVGGDGKGGEVPVVVDVLDERSRGSTGVQDQNAHMALLGEATQDIEEITVAATEALANGGEVIDDEQADVGGGELGLEIKEAFFGSEVIKGIGEREVESVLDVARGEEALGKLVKVVIRAIESEVADASEGGAVGLLIFGEGGDTGVKGGFSGSNVEGEMEGKGGFAGARRSGEEGEAGGKEIKDDHRGLEVR